MVSIQALLARARTHAASALLLGTVLLLALWRIVLVRSGADADSDAYGHHMIARQILADPSDLGVHWVWLPLFHYLQVPLVAAGATMNTIRFINVALWTLVPLILFTRLRRPRTGDTATSALRVPVALFAALLCALSPIGMQMGTTAQPEPLFCLCVLGFPIYMDRGSYWSAALLLGAATMLRYEAWAVLPVVVVCNVLASRARLWGPRASGAFAMPRMGWRRWLPLIVPVVLIFGWAFARRPYDGVWFGFLTQTREFANDAMRTKSSLDGGFSQLASDLFYYAARVPWRVMGPAVLLVPLGLVRTVRTQGILFCLTYLACLGFLTFTWVMRSSLGLDRHFVVMLPFYATLAGNGLAQVIELVGERRRALAFAARVVVACAAFAALITTWTALMGWMHEWRGALETSWPDRIAVGAYLRTIPENDVIFCDEATVELLSGIDRHRFDRHWVDDPSEVVRVKEAAERDGAAYVATWMRKLKGIRAEGEIVYRPPGEESQADDDSGLAVVKVVRE